jgi:nucleoside-diphosphate-sugar epimerase
VSAVILCHMGRNPMAYKPLFEGLSISIRGTALMYDAMREAGVRRVVAISSASALPPSAGGSEPPAALSRWVNGRGDAFLYPLAKTVEEMIAEIYVTQHAFSVTLFRPRWIIYEDDGRSKYGAPETQYSPGLIDPHDIGTAALCALRRPAAGLEAFTLGQPEYLTVAETMQALDRAPRHRFERLKFHNAPVG